MKKELKESFPESIGFYKSEKFVIVYSQYTNPSKYSISTLKGFRLRNDDIIKSLVNMIKQNIYQPSFASSEFLYSPGELKFEFGRIPSTYS